MRAPHARRVSVGEIDATIGIRDDETGQVDGSLK
jgi:hypothetical protein